MSVGEVDNAYDGTQGGDIGNGGDSSTSSMNISTGGLIAIVVVVVLVATIGACTATLFFIAKKREWKASEVVKHSVKKVVTAITPRRTEFPDSIKQSMRSSNRGRSNMNDDDFVNTPRLRPDVEKGSMSGQVESMPRK
ncbi:hypothetical protein NOR_00438 [Metarhizium rileyi]|nr:hypothetical protein NOR_00438 [Metarhizium rileyi RCEF 4871]